MRSHHTHRFISGAVVAALMLFLMNTPAEAGWDRSNAIKETSAKELIIIGVGTLAVVGATVLAFKLLTKDDDEQTSRLSVPAQSYLASDAHAKRPGHFLLKKEQPPVPAFPGTVPFLMTRLPEPSPALVSPLYIPAAYSVPQQAAE